MAAAKRGRSGPSIRAAHGSPSTDLGSLQHYLGFALQRARATVFASITQQLQAFGLTPGEFGVLVVIRYNPALRFIDVTRALGFRQTNFAPLIRALEHRGLVQRRASKTDRRTRTLALTPVGEQIVDVAIESQNSYEAALRALVGKTRAGRVLRALMAMAG